MAKKSKVITIGEKEIVVKSVSMGALNRLGNRASKLIDRAQVDDQLRRTINDLLNVLGDLENINPAVIMRLVPGLSSMLLEELMGAVSDYTSIPFDEIDDMDPEDFTAIVEAIIEVNDYEKIVKLIKNLWGQLLKAVKKGQVEPVQ